MKHKLRIALFALCALTAAAQSRREQKITKELGAREVTLEGVLIDGGCQDRSLWNLTRPAEQQAAALPASNPAASGGQATRGGEATSSGGISVDAKTIKAERQDVTAVMKTELSARQSDPTCALKANTRAYSLLTADGRLLDLDDAGSTYATAAVQASPEGRAMINGHGPGFKPRVTVVGRMQGDRFFTSGLTLEK
jgi:hypothetical protein